MIAHSVSCNVAARANASGSVEAQPSDWVKAHEALSRLAKQRAFADAEEGRWLLAARRSAAHVHLGFGAFGEYVERLFGYGRRLTQEKLRVAEALEDLPALARALESGALSWSAVRELTRVAVPETEAAWLASARGKAVRQLEELVAGKHPGDTPTTRSDPSMRRHVLRFEVTGETFALFREALGELRRRSSSSLDDDAALLQMAREVLGGPADDGRSSYQVALTICAACRAGHQDGSGQVVPVGRDIVDMASCDRQSIGHVDVLANCDRQYIGHVAVPANDAANANAPTPAELDVNPEREGAHGDVQPAGGAARNAQPNHDVTDVGDPPNNGATVESAHSNVDPEREAASSAEPSHEATDVGDLPTSGATSREGAHVGAPESAHVGAPVRAKQDIAPAVRRMVLRRDNQRCRVPSCRYATFLDLHHIVPRSEGGSHHAANLLTVCGAHHRALHRGELAVQGDAGTGVRFRHADGTPYGEPVEARALDTQAKLLAALRGLGFREGEIRRALAELRAEDGLRGATAEAWLRAAIQRLT